MTTETLFKALAPNPYFRLKVNLIDAFLILRLASSTWLTHEFPIQFQPQMGTATNTLLKLHKVNYVDKDISSGLEVSCVLSKAGEVCK